MYWDVFGTLGSVGITGFWRLENFNWSNYEKDGKIWTVSLIFLELEKIGMAKKKLISVWLSFIVLFFSLISISTYVDSAVVQGDYFLKDIVINGENIINYQLRNPLIIYKGSTYVPMDEITGAFLGVHCELDEESRTLSIVGTEPVAVAADLEAEQHVDSTAPVELDLRRDVKKLVIGAGDVSSVSEPARRELSKDMPVLVKDSIVYVPLNAIVSSDQLGWSVCYDNDLGLFISTDDEISAESYFETARLISGKDSQVPMMAAYIQHINANVSYEDAMLMAKAFIVYGKECSIEPELLMAIAHCESTFYSSITNRSGTCIGLMQVNYKTAESHGFTKEQLYDIDANIHVGALVFQDYLSLFENVTPAGLTAYNCGPANVTIDSLSEYADKVLDRYGRIKQYLSGEAGLDAADMVGVDEPAGDAPDAAAAPAQE